MRIFSLLFFLMASLSCSSFEKRSENESILGLWEGLDPTSEESFNYILEISEDSNHVLSARLSMPGFYVDRVPLHSFVFQNDSMRFKYPPGPIQMEFSGEFSNGKIVGSYKSYGQDISLTFAKVPPLRKPQTPKPPFSYVEEEVSFYNRDSSVVFGGTFSYPKEGKKYPAVIFIAGSGDQDRDASIFFHKPFHVIADYLSSRGIAVLRLDDRGVGKTSKGPARVMPDLTEDALCAFDFLAARENILPDKIAIFGHSQGGLTALDAAAKNRKIASVIVVGAPLGFAGTELLLDKIKLKFKNSTDNKETNSKVVSVFDTTFQIILQASSIDEAEPLITSALKDWLHANQSDTEALSILKFNREDIDNQMAIESFLRKNMSIYFSRDQYCILKYEPDSVFKHVQSPILALFGDKDQLVKVEDNYAAAKSFGGANGVVMEMAIIPNMNHFLQTSKTGAPTEVFGIEETVSPRLLETLNLWLQKQFELND